MILLLTNNHTLVQGMAALLATIAESAELVTVQNATAAHSRIAAGTVVLVIVDGALDAVEIEPFFVRQAASFPPVLLLAEGTDQVALARHRGGVFILKGSPAEDLLSLLIKLLSSES